MSRIKHILKHVRIYKEGFALKTPTLKGYQLFLQHEMKSPHPSHNTLRVNGNIILCLLHRMEVNQTKTKYMVTYRAFISTVDIGSIILSVPEFTSNQPCARNILDKPRNHKYQHKDILLL